MSQHRSDLHILLNFSIYIYFPDMFSEIGFLCDINLVVKIIILIDLHGKVTMSETFEKSQMSESFDVPAGCWVPAPVLPILFSFNSSH